MNFDLDHLPWEYEPKVFREGRFSYTPDFLIRGFLWVEVKGDGVAMNPSLRLCPRPLIILAGSPRVHMAVLVTDRLLRCASWEAAYARVEDCTHAATTTH